MDTITEYLIDHFSCILVQHDPACILVAIIALLHVVFAFVQVVFWRRTARALTYLDELAIADARGLGASIASYNFAIAIGLALSFGMEEAARVWVHIVVMVLIIFTALVGWSTTKGNRVLYVRLLPAAVTLAALFLLPVLLPQETAAPETSGAATGQAPSDAATGSAGGGTQDGSGTTTGN